MTLFLLAAVTLSWMAVGVLVVWGVRLRPRLATVEQRLDEVTRELKERSAPTPIPDVGRVDVTEASLDDEAEHVLDEIDEVDVTVITALDPDRDRDEANDPTTARIASVTLGGPLIKVTAFSHGVRQALREEHRMRVAYVVRKELRRQRKLRRRRRSGQASSQGWQS